MSQKTLDDFPISKRWAPRTPGAIQLYSFPTPNGVKVSAMLEECGLPYDAHTVKLSEAGSPEFKTLNINGKIPAIVDPSGPDGGAFGLWESGAILIYLAEKTGKFLPENPAERYETIQWVMFQMAGIGPMFGQYAFFLRGGGAEMEDRLPRERYFNETVRLLNVLETRLSDRANIMGDDLTIADIANFPWVRTARDYFNEDDALGLSGLTNVMGWLDRCLARPAVDRSLNQPPRE
ncbi:glutathione S-transferase family protein [Sinisalibacter aestuarii]|uniref:Glutathione S-transferase n=1 Tax=Sinisalibacter aestuarii TaxID=2949426 RepID=A0ABQ5LTT4_9RHOB|nr:glutathione S-transferase N-terminal domain-containing protein [Sinisalibacter aestuarii]GKY87741.1 glutathione S-transferase [Sinisalibacter aestuarii]